MKHPIKLDPFQGTFVHFRGVTGGEVQPKSTEMASRYRFNYWMNSQGLAAMGTILLSGAPGGKFASKTVALGGGGFKYFQCSTLYMVYLHIFTYMCLVDFYGFHIIYRSWILWTSCLNWKCQGIQDTEVAVSCFVQHHTGPQKVADEGKSPLFPGHLGWWNIIIWPDFIYAMNRMEDVLLFGLWCLNKNFSSLCCLENVSNNWHGIWWKFQEIAPINQHQRGFGFISGLGWMKWMMDMKDLVFIASTQAGRRYYTIIWSWQLYIPIPSMYDINLPTSGWFLWFSCR